MLTSRKRKALVLVAVAVFTATMFLQSPKQIEITGTSHKQHDLRRKVPLDPTRLPDNESSEKVCSKFRWQPISHQRRLYDFFFINNELLWLEIRLNELFSVVDKFVVVESAWTFSGHKKPLYLKENWEMFSKFHEKIVHVVLEEEKDIKTASAFKRERFQRNQTFIQGFARLGSELRNDDVILISDVDEIPKPLVLQALKQCQFPDPLALQAGFYYYSFETIQSEKWWHPQATLYKGKETLGAHELRHSYDNWIENAAWHCSYCFPTIKDYQNKLVSFSHREYNTDYWLHPLRILNVVQKGIDMFERVDSKLMLIENNPDMPEYVKKSLHLAFMRTRRTPTGGFSHEELARYGIN